MEQGGRGRQCCSRPHGSAVGPWGTSLNLSPLVHRTDALLLRLSLVVGKEVFYAALWGSVLVSPSIRLPASLFVVGHISRDSPGREQKYMLGTDYQLTVKSLCTSLLDSNVLVQRNNLEIVLFFFPFYTCLVRHSCSSRKVTAISQECGVGGIDPRQFFFLRQEQPRCDHHLLSAG